MLLSKPILERPHRLARRNLLGALSIFVVIASGCEITNAGEPQVDLDAELIAALTIDGQRPLSEFILPSSDNFAEIPQDPGNPLTQEKVQLGKLLFHDAALATSPKLEMGRGTYSCATCHHAAAGFQAGRQQSLAEGGSGWGLRGELRRVDPRYAIADVDVQDLKSPTVLNSAYQRVTMWDGSMGANGPNEGTEASWVEGTPEATNQLGYDGVESQSIAAVQAHRMGAIETSIVTTHPTYTELWEQAFPTEPVSAVTAGLAMAAFQRTLLANKAPFQKWLRGDLDAMSAAEKRGALVFVEAECETCHTGPALNSMAFYALGMEDMRGPGVIGEIASARGRGEFVGDRLDDFKFKVPQLYNLADSPFYGHGGTFTSIREIVDYYNDGVPDLTLPPDQLAPRFLPLHLSRSEVDDLVEFLTVSLRDPDLLRYQPGQVPSGGCIPANDAAARQSLGC